MLFHIRVELGLSIYTLNPTDLDIPRLSHSVGYCALNLSANMLMMIIHRTSIPIRSQCYTDAPQYEEINRFVLIGANNRQYIN